MKEKSKFISKITVIAVLSSITFAALNAASLYPVNNRFGNIADKIAAQRGDILRIIVAESRSTANTLTTTTSKESSINNTVNQFLFPIASSGFGTHNGALPGTDISGQNEYTGGGTITSAQTLSDSFSVTVVDVLPNGNLVIQGNRMWKDSDQTEYVTFTGIVRYNDIASANTVFSNQIADLRLIYASEGVIRKAQKKGWLGKLNEILNPF